MTRRPSSSSSSWPPSAPAACVEMRLSRRHQRALAARGAPRCPSRCSRAMVALHTGVLVARGARGAARCGARSRPRSRVPALALVALANALRLWVIATLGAALERARRAVARRSASSPRARTASCATPTTSPCSSSWRAAARPRRVPDGARGRGAARRRAAPAHRRRGVGADGGRALPRAPSAQAPLRAAPAAAGPWPTS